MTWTKLGDEFADQCWKLSDAAFRLHTEGLVWSNRRHLDGRLDKTEIQRWAKCSDAAAELVALGWWDDLGDAYQIVNHLGWQRTAEQWLKQSQANRANRAKGKARPVKRRPKADPTEEPTEELSDEPSDEPSDERDWSGQDRTGLEEETTYKAQDGELVSTPAASWPSWRGSGPDPFDEYA